MKNLFKKNPALFIGLMLLLLMILVSAGFPFIQSLMLPTPQAPQYNFIYSLANYNNGKLKVVDGKLVLRISNDWPMSIPLGTPPGIYLVDVHSKKSTALQSPLLKGETVIPAYGSREFIFEGISLKDLDASTTAPDGYQIKADSIGSSLFAFMLYFTSYKQTSISLKKSGHTEVIPVPTRDQAVQGKFEGWVIPK